MEISIVESCALWRPYSTRAKVVSLARSFSLVVALSSLPSRTPLHLYLSIALLFPSSTMLGRSSLPLLLVLGLVALVFAGDAAIQLSPRCGSFSSPSFDEKEVADLIAHIMGVAPLHAKSSRINFPVTDIFSHPNSNLIVAVDGVGTGRWWLGEACCAASVLSLDDTPNAGVCVRVRVQIR